MDAYMGFFLRTGGVDFALLDYFGSLALLVKVHHGLLIVDEVHLTRQTCPDAHAQVSCKFKKERPAFSLTG